MIYVYTNLNLYCKCSSAVELIAVNCVLNKTKVEYMKAAVLFGCLQSSEAMSQTNCSVEPRGDRLTISEGCPAAVGQHNHKPAGTNTACLPLAKKKIKK